MSTACSSGVNSPTGCVDVTDGRMDCGLCGAAVRIQSEYENQRLHMSIVCLNFCLIEMVPACNVIVVSHLLDMNV